MRAVDALPCQNDVLSCQSHDMLHPVCPRKCSMCTRPFPSLRVGSGNETNWLSVCSFKKLLADLNYLVLGGTLTTNIGVGRYSGSWRGWIYNQRAWKFFGNAHFWSNHAHFWGNCGYSHTMFKSKTDTELQIRLKKTSNGLGTIKVVLAKWSVWEDSKVAKKMVMIFHFVKGWRFW